MQRRRLGAAAAVSFCAVLGACGGADEGAAQTFSKSQANTVVELTASRLLFHGMPDSVEGPSVFFEVVNQSDVHHDLEVLKAPGGERMGRIEPFGPGEVRSLAVDLPPGNYIVRCEEKLIDARHSDLGMLDELVVK